jgi:hypothetical protein
MTMLRRALVALDLDDESDMADDNLGLFAAHFNRFCILHEEHTNHEDQVIFKTFNDSTLQITVRSTMKTTPRTT